MRGQGQNYDSELAKPVCDIRPYQQASHANLMTNQILVN